MKTPFSLLLFTAAAAMAGTPSDAKVNVVPEDDRWKFTIAIPGFMAGVEGDTGFGSRIADVDFGFWDDLFPHIDMIWATDVEVSKGRFGVLGELIYLGLSDGIGPNGRMIKKVDIKFDEYLTDFALRWRMVEGPRGYVDLLVGVRYTSIYQELRLQSNDDVIATTTAKFVDDVGERIREDIRETIEERFGEGQFRNALVDTIDRRITKRLEEIIGTKPARRTLPVAALAADVPPRVARVVERLVLRERTELIAAVRSTVRAAAEAEAAAIRATLAVDRARLRARVEALRARVDLRISTAKRNLEKRIQRELESQLNQTASSFDNWWDPYIGIRGRYNFNEKYYITARGDIGGFSVGSDLMWQAEAAFGVQLSQSVFAEFGYRALAYDYDQDNFVYDVILHGAQVRVGVTF